ncbi:MULTISPECIES: formyltransferase family protein [unclassified Staphylococcus]|uniref:methionyl-tRNA formyltransferase n=1 Tax=unclassified Staphylococcus TaxID=91994 RepID=UPI0021D0094A|nr:MULTISPECIES: formyltransferase family protein [unclassified Staphylococcus]UXR77954.1 methionyl-tRNA formyltransferase [Staphylococcus sp. IVB6227]UXR82115.1 methionyl-tRNA formyltransferase [Staphylococcus sp. IVB6214]
MNQKFNIILFSEVNSKFGMSFFKRIYYNNNFEITALVTTPKGKLCSYYIGESDTVDLEKFAFSKNIPVYRPDNIKTDSLYESLKMHSPDYLLIANYQMILSPNLIKLPKYDTLNFHPSLLPKYAGLSPFFWMAKKGEKESGVTCIKVVPVIDGGDIVKQLPIKLTGNETTREIRDKLFEKSIDLLDEVLNDIVQQSIKSYPQNILERDYFSKPTESDMLIDHNIKVNEALSILRACAPESAFLDLDTKKIKINAVSWSPMSKGIMYHLKDGKLYFIPENHKELSS